MIQRLPEQEKQDILEPLFAEASPGLGYRCLAALAKQRPVVVLNLNWDTMLAEACALAGVKCDSFDIASENTGWPVPSGDSGLTCIHLHGQIGHECRYGTLETLSFSPDAEEYMTQHALSQTLGCVGASLVGENDLPQLFERWRRADDPVRSSSSQWFFLRGDSEAAEDKMIKETLFASGLTFVRASDVDFDEFALIATDAAIADEAKGR